MSNIVDGWMVDGLADVLTLAAVVLSSDAMIPVLALLAEIIGGGGSGGATSMRWRKRRKRKATW